MDREKTVGFFHIFIIAIVILFMIIVIVPYGIDKAVHFFIMEIMPGSNSIIVFRNLPDSREILTRYFEILKMLTNFM